MTVKDLIAALMEADLKLDDYIEIYVCAKTDVIGDYYSSAGGCEWCLDENLEIEEIENRGGHIWLKTEIV